MTPLYWLNSEFFFSTQGYCISVQRITFVHITAVMICHNILNSQGNFALWNWISEKEVIPECFRRGVLSLGFFAFLTLYTVRQYLFGTPYGENIAGKKKEKIEQIHSTLQLWWFTHWHLYKSHLALCLSKNISDRKIWIPINSLFYLKVCKT
jgi:hypothetical protein